MRERKCKIPDDFFADKGNMNKHIKSVYEDRKEFKIIAPRLIPTLFSTTFKHPLVIHICLHVKK